MDHTVVPIYVQGITYGSTRRTRRVIPMCKLVHAEKRADTVNSGYNRFGIVRKSRHGCYPLRLSNWFEVSSVEAR